jgi:GNAT superfamily N-acetyltransferase
LHAIRRAEERDVEAVARLFRDVRLACLPYLPDLHTPRKMPGSSAIGCSRMQGVVAEAETIDGFIAFRAGWIDHLYVRPQCQRGGIGTALFAVRCRKAHCCGFGCCQRNTAAIAFYLARGFREIERTDGSGNEEREPDILMEWRAEARGSAIVMSALRPLRTSTRMRLRQANKRREETVVSNWFLRHGCDEFLSSAAALVSRGCGANEAQSPSRWSSPTRRRRHRYRGAPHRRADGARAGRNVIIENVVGGGSTIANDRVARSAPDGSTVLINHVALLAAPSLFSNCATTRRRRSSRSASSTTRRCC